MKGFILASFLFFSLTILFYQNSSATDSTAHFKKVVWIVFENEDYQPVMNQPDFARIANYGASFTRLKAETHPSQGNYIAMIAGSILGVKDDSNVDLNESHVGDLLEKAGMRWRVYAEDYPGNCFLDKKSGDYARKHVPFLSFTNVTKNPKRCANIENENRFFQDFQNGTLPEFSMYIPNLKNDGHDTGVDYAGKWLSAKFGNILTSPYSTKDTLFIVTFDEGSRLSRNIIYTVLVGSKIKSGSENSQKINHSALLKMIEDEFKIGNLGREDASSPVLTGIWK